MNKKFNDYEIENKLLALRRRKWGSRIGIAVGIGSFDAMMYSIHIGLRPTARNDVLYISMFFGSLISTFVFILYSSHIRSSVMMERKTLIDEEIIRNKLAEAFELIMYEPDKSFPAI